MLIHTDGDRVELLGSRGFGPLVAARIHALGPDPDWR